MAIPPEEDAKLEKLFALDRENEAKAAQDAARLKSLLESRRDQVYVIRVFLPKTEMNDETADYGTYRVKKWLSREVSEIVGDPIFKKDQDSIMKPELRLTAAEKDSLVEMMNGHIARALQAARPDQLTEKDLDDLGLYALTQYLFSALMGLSGMDSRTTEDIVNFLERTRASPMA